VLEHYRFSLPSSQTMIKEIIIDLIRLSQEGKRYKWKRPDECTQCKGKLWGHGYVSAYFDCCSGLVYLKRWICSLCRLVIKMKPIGYWKYFRSSIGEILKTLQYRLTQYLWPPGVSRQRGGHWLNRYVRICKEMGMKILEDNELVKISFESV